MAVNTWLTGPDGEKSSKRLIGFSLTLIGVLWELVAGCVYLITGAIDGDFILRLGLQLIGAGVGLLGFGTVAERIGR
jgi:hypothetical protein